MFRILTQKIIPVVSPLVGVLCIGSCIKQEYQYQTRYWTVNDTYVVKKKETDDEEYRAIMYNFFFH